MGFIFNVYLQMTMVFPYLTGTLGLEIASFSLSSTSTFQPIHYILNAQETMTVET